MEEAEEEEEEGENDNNNKCIYPSTFNQIDPSYMIIKWGKQEML